MDEQPSTNELALGPARLQSTRSDGIMSITDDLRGRLAPATHCLYEWTDYWLTHPSADRLRLGTTWQPPVVEGVFRVRFENRLGLAAIQPFAGSSALSPLFHVEVISPKFPDPSSHIAFYRALLDDLFARAARLPFAIDTPTSRGVTESPRPPSALFALHFFLQYAPALQTALAIIQASPHRRLRERPAEVPVADAAEVDADVLIAILHAPQAWVPARGFPLADKLGGFSPERVWQRLPQESVDTPENRFVLAAVRAFLVAAEALQAQRWWWSVPPERHAVIREVGSLLRRTIALPLFAEVGPMTLFPAASRVLTRREGYRDLLALWQSFQHSRRPLFAPLRHAIETRDVATLYEIWAFFTLIEEIAVLLNESPVIDLRTNDDGVLACHTAARFGHAGRLVYNRPARSYSRIPMRPDFTWIPAHGPEVALDAKFRLVRRHIEPDESTPEEATVKHDDLYRMHAYRDALGMRAAVVIYPGDRAVFHNAEAVTPARSLGDMLLGGWTGIGPVAMSPTRWEGVR